MTLTPVEARERIAAMKGGATAPPAVAKSYKHVVPLASQAETLIDSLAAPDGISLGLPDVDVLTRGFRPRELVFIVGFAHSSKTQLALTMIKNSPHKRVLFFSLDDPAELLLAKLVAMIEGTPAVELEERVRMGDQGAARVVREVATNALPNLLIIDKSLGIGTMQEAIAEADDCWGALPDAVLVDFLEMVPSEHVVDDQGNNVKAKSRLIKAWANQLPFPVIVVHQGTRSNSKPGAPITIMSAAFGGEQEASLLLGVRRKRDYVELADEERYEHTNTVSVHVVKNKKAGGRLTHHEGIDFYLDAATGLIRPLQAGDLLSQQPRMQPVSSAVAASQATVRSQPIWRRDDLA